MWLHGSKEYLRYDSAWLHGAPLGFKWTHVVPRSFSWLPVELHIWLQELLGASRGSARSSKELDMTPRSYSWLRGQIRILKAQEAQETSRDVTHEGKGQTQSMPGSL